MAFKKALIERALGAELGHHLGYPNGEGKPEATTNQRNGKRPIWPTRNSSDNKGSPPSLTYRAIVRLDANALTSAATTRGSDSATSV